MTSRQRLRKIIARQPADRCGFWLGQPDRATWPLYLQHFQASSQEHLRQILHDDFRWICPQFRPETYAQPGARRLDSIKPPKTAHGQAGIFAQVDTVQQILDFDWPQPVNLDFTKVLDELDNAGDVYRASGFWTCFYHDVMDLFGMEDYLVKMFEQPAVVHAVTDKVCQYYYDANEAFFAAAGQRVDAYFFGNDFGTQLDLIMSPALFDEFVMPWFKRFTEQGHRHGHQVILHSCGAIHRVIERLIEAQVDCLHPLQAKAAHMDADTLARDFAGRITFLGGVDTQHLLVHGTPEEIRHDVRRIKKLLAPNLIVSPSHEAILPNVPAANILAMAQTAIE